MISWPQSSPIRLPWRTLAVVPLACVLAALAALLCAATAAAADTTVLRVGHLIDPATGSVTRDQLIVVTGENIVAVSSGADIPPGSTVIDLSRAWVMPGLMDAHVHLTYNTPPGGHSITPYYTETTGFRTLRGLHNARLVLESGFTTVKDIGNSGAWAMVDVRRAMDQGWFVGPTILDAGKIIAPYGGAIWNLTHEIEPPPWHYEYLDADTPEDIRKSVRRNVYHGANTIKLVADSNRYYYTVEEIRAAVEEAARAGMKVAVHVVGGPAADNVILGGAHSIEHGFDLTDKQLELMKTHGTYLSGTDFPADHLAAMDGMKADAQRMADKIVDRLRRAWQIGTPMAFGTDVVVDLPGKHRGEMGIDFIRSWIAAGIPAAGILRAMTTNNAILLGVEKERGAIKAGFKADIIAMPLNPLEDINALRSVQFVMKNGNVVKQQP